MVVLASAGVGLTTMLGHVSLPSAVADIPATDRPTSRPTAPPRATSAGTRPPTPAPSPTPTPSAPSSGRPTQTATTIAANVKVLRSANWAGFGLMHGEYTDVSAEWTQPEVDCTPGHESHVAFWVGLDGADSDFVEQTGTGARCPAFNAGRPEYYAWYEMYPDPMRTTDHVDVRPGDHFKASVHAISAEKFELKLENTTTGRSFSITQERSGVWPTSAEWIVEPAALCRPACRISTLAEFEDTAFSNMTVGTVDGAVELNAGNGLVKFDLHSLRGRLADVSPLVLGDAGSFGVEWLGDGSSAAPTSLPNQPPR